MNTGFYSFFKKVRHKIKKLCRFLIIKRLVFIERQIIKIFFRIEFRHSSIVGKDPFLLLIISCKFISSHAI